jgi:membrane protease YdiL (CAAX protease family)
MPAPSSRLLPLAVIGEGALAIAGGVWLYWAGYAVRLGATPGAIAAGLTIAAALAATQWWLQVYGPDREPIRSLRSVQHTVFEPLFAPLSTAELVAISALAGVGEEIFFRGALQSAFGWPLATLAFGACHLGLSGRGWVLGLWATLAGAGLAGLAIATGGLAAPIVAHAGYDLAALLWIRRQARAGGGDGRFGRARVRVE